MAASDNDETAEAVQAVLKYMTDIEILAEDILVDKQMIVSLDKRRNGHREAFRSIRNTDKSNQSWMCFGDTFIELPNGSIQNLLEKGQENTQAEINKLHENLKPKMAQLYEMEGKQPRKGFDLKPLSRDELSNVTQARN
ncbi:p53 and DNA damage-regulated protein 1 [Trichoplax sp. H2]|nr:p53 and DNA damage-regulated protein 1 [Trichoplax sp. H2]|eukprot:RDD46928.1 p53 and DNA damage-regulated protein 1 [Trichoplax sp. H2]